MTKVVESFKVLIVQSDLQAAQSLSSFFRRRGDQVWQLATAQDASALLERGKNKPDLALIDLHLPDDAWVEVLHHVRRQTHTVKVIVTNRYPDLRRELMAKEQGIRVFLRQPFTREWIQRALDRTDDSQAAGQLAAIETRLPAVRTPMRLKITLPYILLALLFALAAAYLISRYVQESSELRFTNQLIDARKLAAEWMVNEEDRILKTVRQVAFTDGVATAVASGNAERLRELVLPIAVTNHEEALDILDTSGRSVISLRHAPEDSVANYAVTKGETAFASWESVKKVLAVSSDQRGDKYAEVVQASWGNYFYIAGPIVNSQARLVGAILVGKSLSRLALEMQQSTLAHASLYDQQGLPLASTLPLNATALPAWTDKAAQVLSAGNQGSEIRSVSASSTQYTEIVGPWQARGAAVGLLGTTLAPGYLARASLVTQIQAFGIALVAFLLIIIIGLLLAAQITRPLRHMVATTAQVAQGNLEVKIDAQGSDEVAALGHAFNYMVAGLQEGNVYRDLLGRTVSPEVRDELRLSFASGDLRLEGQAATATVVMSDIRGFTTLAEKQEPTTILRWLNEYYSELVPIITAHGGVVDKFEGDAILAFFGVLPRVLPAAESAAQACRAAQAMMNKVNYINASRQERGEPLLITGIGLNTGLVIAGGLGAADRLNYTIIGDTVNTTQRLESFTREFGETAAAISETTYEALGQRSAEFRFQPLGKHRFKGKSDDIAVYRLLPDSDPSAATRG